MARRGIAVVVGAWFVLAGLLGLRHEAQHPHVIDGRTGALVHAERLVGHHAADALADIHGIAEHGGDHGACSIATALHQAASAHTSALPSTSVVACAKACASGTARDTAAVRRVYRLAPKTSPPIG